MSKVLYTADVEVTGGRDGRAVSDDGLLDLALTLPKSLGGSGLASNPEQLFAAGFGACFNSSVRHSAKRLGLDAGNVDVRSAVSLLAWDDGSFGLAVALTVAMPGLTGEQAQVVLAEAERVCAYTNATRGNVAAEIRLAS